MTIEDLKKLATQTRRDILRMVYNVQSGHPGGAFGATEFFWALYGKIMDYDPKNFTMDGKNEDLFFLSSGHLSAVWYSVLARTGFFPVNELDTFRKLDSRLQGHPTTHEGLPGIRIASGSLGQGLSVAIGAALAKKLNHDDKLVFTFHGDGELEEGQIWEALMYASAKKVDNIISTVDYNGQQIDGTTKHVLDLGDLKAKFEAFGWDTLDEPNGNNMEAVIAVLEKAKSLTGKGKPVAILLHTQMGYGVDFMQGTHTWHGKAPNAEQLEKAFAQLPETVGDY
ncbi:MAG: transketolase [Flavobacteriaceae bacterium]|jgi:transketolase|nr:transketolase [Flavobacteriaceae bacterium]